MLRVTTWLCIWVICLAGPALAVAETTGTPADPEGEARIAGLRVPHEIQVRLVASSPQLQSPVAICVDRLNRVFAAEVHRFNRGTEENRNRTFLLDEDLRAQSIDDRLDSYRRHVEQFGGSMDYFTQYSDRIVRLVDRDGDGRMDQSTVFADDFRDPLSGLGAGILVRDDIAWYTNIPDLWRLEDRDDDGVAEQREVLVRGFGVQNAFLGHDLHGLTWGPDGKLYFSVGDRGYHVETTDGHTWHGPRNGAVFRCAPDGSDFEVVFTGLRNPQDLAFDDEGNLFTGDNNCDKGDYGRLVYVVEGGHAGWNMAYQTLVEPYLTGPWHAEGIWHVSPAFRPAAAAAPPDNRWLNELSRTGNSPPAWLVPPVGAIGSGPAGLTCHPGSGPLGNWRGQLLMCNFTGDGGLEGIRVEPAGAGFRITAIEDLCKPISATDVAFTFDGRILLSDYVGLNWDGSSAGGRLYSLCGPAWPADFSELSRLSAQDFRQSDEASLVSLLAHTDRRIRQRAQFALAERGDAGAAAFVRVLRDPASDRLAKLHSLWGIGQQSGNYPAAMSELITTLNDSDASLRAQAARVTGWRRAVEALPRLIVLLADPQPRVQMFAAEALGKLDDVQAVDPLFELSCRNANRDPVLRHAACYALAKLGAADAAVARVDSSNVAERLAAVIVLRHQRDPRVAQFLDDADLQIVTEAARAINDVPLNSAMHELAAWQSSNANARLPDALARRVINACFRLGDAPQARHVLQMAQDENQSLPVRAEAISALRDWSSAASRDRVTGFWRPTGPRDPQVVRDAVGSELRRLPERVPNELRVAAIDLLRQMRLAPSIDQLSAWINATGESFAVRAAAVRCLGTLQSPAAIELLQSAGRDDHPKVRMAALDALTAQDHALALPLLTQTALDDQTPTLAERQAALRLLSGLNEPVANDALAIAMEKLNSGHWPAALTLDVIEASRQRPQLLSAVQQFENERAQQPVLKRLDYLRTGGDADRGRSIFFNHVKAQCVRCHQIGLDGGIAGPKLDGVASRHSDGERGYFLESMVEPSAKFATGFESCQLELEDGRILSGVVQGEDDDAVMLRQPDGSVKRITKTDIEARRTTQSLMPAMLDVLEPGEIRDLVEFLTTLR